MSGKFSGVLLSTDLDGTFYDSNSIASAEAIRATEYFIANGGSFMINTGRVRCTNNAMKQGVPVNMPVAVGNGAMIFDYDTNEVLAAWLMDKDAETVMNELAARYPETALELYDMDDFAILRENESSKMHMAAYGLTVEQMLAPSRKKIPLPPWVKINFTGDEKLMREFYDAARKKYTQYEFTMSCKHFVEMTSPDADKGKALSWVAERYGFKKENVYAAGDNLNDISMLRAAGTGFVPCNGSPEAIRAADVITPDNNHNVIKHVIEYIDKRY